MLNIIAEVLCKNYDAYFKFIELNPSFTEVLSDRGIFEIVESIVNRRITHNKGKAMLQKVIGVASKDWKLIGFWMDQIYSRQGKKKINTSVSLSPDVYRVIDDYKLSGGNKSLFLEYAALEVFKSYGRLPTDLKKFVNKSLGVEYHKNKTDKQEIEDESTDELLQSVEDELNNEPIQNHSIDDLDDLGNEEDMLDADEMREILKREDGKHILMSKGIPEAFLDRLLKK